MKEDLTLAPYIEHMEITEPFFEKGVKKYRVTNHAVFDAKRFHRDHPWPKQKLLTKGNK